MKLLKHHSQVLVVTKDFLLFMGNDRPQLELTTVQIRRLYNRHGHRSKKILAASYMKRYDVKSP